ncbi:transcription termination factor Rho [Granulicatella elegans]|uniref:Transcription termination factor Rho n=1 Tax=Granulicatella elegans ATCC 700633 TaxID=626369 RepID=D0BJ83_9LACT|nr:transcription termination factor Rho [Granulicatella elegans]EEW93136.2 transcription termination factor Rho [Granulicatella elegans ATCC 700633]
MSETIETVTLPVLQQKTLKEMYAFAKHYKIPYYGQMNKKELALAIMRAQEEATGFFQVEGVLDINNAEGYGFLRPINYSTSQEDIYISSSQIRKFALRNGDLVAGPARPPRTGEKFNGLMQVGSVNGKDPEEAKERDHFPGLTPLYPEKQMHLETTTGRIASRMLDLICPIGFGQRGLIVAPPKAGKTSLLKEIANGITTNYPEAELIILLIDERPEEVTDIERTVEAEVVFSTFDQTPEHHIKVSELVLERALRLVEDGRDVIVLLDSITRLARAYNLTIPPSGRTLSGGIDPAAFYRPKRFFGSARNIEDGGSLTILATALIETGSRMDDVIYEEFKGTGNAEVHLSRELAERRVFPAIDVKRSGTRKEEILLEPHVLEAVWKVRNTMKGDGLETSEQMVKQLRETKSNKDFIKRIELL